MWLRWAAIFIWGFLSESKKKNHPWYLTWYNITFVCLLIPRKSWRQNMRCQSWSEVKYFRHCADMEVGHGSWLRQDSLQDLRSGGGGGGAPSNCPGEHPVGLRGEANHSAGRGGHPLITPSVQRTLPEEKLSVHNFPWYSCYFEPFFPKRMFHFN